MTDPSTSERPVRLNWGCGTEPEAGWINSDIKRAPEIDISADILEGLPLADESIDYVVSIHALPELPYPSLVPALMELRRVIKKGGLLRLALPDLDRAIAAYRSGDRGYFLIPDEDARTLGGKLAVQMTWYGYSRSLFTVDFVEELMTKAGFTNVHHRAFKETGGPFPGIVELDNRESESLFVEGTRQ
jgi:predicted SAM-dependent methyltransferase